ncbi:MAG: hypothetical protein JW787_07390 [Sedimentisphaerales bacterium]|nr:hypothetical protein [Sedimentisphaerales bacterium]
MTLADNTERLVEQMRLKTSIAADERILRDAFAKFELSSPFTKKMTLRSNFAAKYIGIAAAAAVIFIFWTLIMSYAKLASPKKIYNSLVKNENFCISNYLAGQEQPFQQLWVSKSLDIKLFRNIESNSQLLTLWDVSRSNKMVLMDAEKSLKTEPITERMLDEMEKSTVQAFSLSRFTDLKKIPKNIRRHRVHDQKINSQIPDTEVFELSWKQKNSAGKMQYLKWRIFIKEKTNEIKRTELYTKSESDEQYELDSMSIISYPEEEEIKTLIRKNFDTVISYPEYRPTGI